MRRAKPSPASRFAGQLTVACGVALSLVVAIPVAAAERSPDFRTWGGEKEAEELEGSFEERVRELQGWLRQRDAERNQSWGNDVVTPENRAPDPPPAPRYFGDRGLDAQGYRRLNENTRFRLRTQAPSWSLATPWAGDAAAPKHRAATGPKKRGGSRSKPRRRIRRR